MQALTLSKHWANLNSNYFQIFGVNIHKNTFKEATDWVIAGCLGEQGSKVNSITDNTQHKKLTCHFVNADCLNQAYTNHGYSRILNSVDRVFADGSGVSLACKIKQLPNPENVNGTDLFPAICHSASKLQKSNANAKRLKVYLLGGKPGIAKAMQENMQVQFPDVDFVGTQHGYFEQHETSQVIESINASHANLLLVAMGAPKQELWIEQFRSEINCSVCMGVGGLFDYYSNNIPRAPMWMRNLGCEWVWRFMQEPRRLAKRYLMGNFVFTSRVISEYLKTQKSASSTLNPAFSVYPQNGSSPLQKIKLFCQSFVETVSPSRKLHRIFQQGGKRAVDIIGASMAILAFSPIMLLSMLCIYLESPGNVFFSQQRVGKNGTSFKLWKFRSMHTNAEDRLKEISAQNEMRGGVLFKMKEDPRITNVGKFVRKYSIDELPQLWNVLTGDMSLVGPRPALPKEVEQYKTKDRQRLHIKPGITCIWQVSGRSDIPFEKQVELDHQYVCQQSILTDIKLLFATVPAVLMAKGAY